MRGTEWKACLFESLSSPSSLLPQTCETRGGDDSPQKLLRPSSLLLLLLLLLLLVSLPSESLLLPPPLLLLLLLLLHRCSLLPRPFLLRQLPHHLRLCWRASRRRITRSLSRRLGPRALELVHIL